MNANKQLKSYKMKKTRQTIYDMPIEYRAIVEEIRQKLSMAPTKNSVYIEALRIGLEALKKQK